VDAKFEESYGLSGVASRFEPSFESSAYSGSRVLGFHKNVPSECDKLACEPNVNRKRIAK
jgi:hypothetical protein